MTAQVQPQDSYIVVVEGQEFSVPTAVDIETVRKQLTPNFPNLANADLKRSKREVNGVQVEVVEFIKKAGTKGLDHADLARLVRSLPPLKQQTTAKKNPLLLRIERAQMTFGEALDPTLADRVADALGRAIEQEQTYTEFTSSTKEHKLCSQVDALPAVASGQFVW